MSLCRGDDVSVTVGNEVINGKVTFVEGEHITFEVTMDSSRVAKKTGEVALPITRFRRSYIGVVLVGFAFAVCLLLACQRGEGKIGDRKVKSHLDLPQYAIAFVCALFCILPKTLQFYRNCFQQVKTLHRHCCERIPSHRFRYRQIHQNDEPSESVCAKKIGVAHADPMEVRLLHHRIILIAGSDPSQIALIIGNEVETYGQLYASVLYVAKHLVEERGVKPKSRTPIGVCAEGIHMLHAILGIVHTGNPYVPLPSDLPPSSRDFMVADANVQVVLADPLSLSPGGVWAGRAAASPQHVLESSLNEDWKQFWLVTEDDLAYMLYTSGSTGKPKGVLASHASYHNRLTWMWEAYPAATGEVGIQKTALIWVDHLQEIFGILGSGMPLVLATAAARKNPNSLIDLCRQHRVSRLVLVPSLLRFIVATLGRNLGIELPYLRFWIISGEPLPTELLRVALEAAAPESKMLNTYGTTEVAGDVTWAAYKSASDLPDSTIVPIGKAIPPNTCHLLDPDTLRPVRPGECGEIFVEGPHLAAGYHNRPEENEARFLKLLHLGIERAFRTGDFGRLDQHQMLHFMGRRDQQVKVHGQRVEVLQVEFELGEALLAYGSVGGYSVKSACAVQAIPSKEHHGSYRLLAFIEMAGIGGNSCDVDDLMQKMLRQHMLKALLPAHVPEAFICVERLPRLVNGKLDRVALHKLGDEVQPSRIEVTDSLGITKKVAAAEHQEVMLLERCYCIWAVQVVIDHTWLWYKEDGSGWVRIVREGMAARDVTMCGFMVCNAWVESKTMANTGRSAGPDGRMLVCYILFLMMSFPLPGLSDCLSGNIESDLLEPQINYTRWFLFVIVWSRLCIWGGDAIRLRVSFQLALHWMLAVLIPNGFLDVCSMDTPYWLRWLASWSLSPYWFKVSYYCPIYENWLQWWTALYISAFHLARPAWRHLESMFINHMRGTSWGIFGFAMYIATSCVVNSLHGEGVVLNQGIHSPKFSWGWLAFEIIVPTLASLLLIFAMSRIPLDLTQTLLHNAYLPTFVLHSTFILWSGIERAAVQWIANQHEALGGLLYLSLIVVEALCVVILSAGATNTLKVFAKCAVANT